MRWCHLCTFAKAVEAFGDNYVAGVEAAAYCYAVAPTVAELYLLPMCFTAGHHPHIIFAVSSLLHSSYRHCDAAGVMCAEPATLYLHVAHHAR